MSYIDALYKKDEDKIYVVERDPKKGRVFVEYDARYVFYYPDARGKHRGMTGEPLQRVICQTNKEFIKEQRIRSNKQLYEHDINPYPDVWRKITCKETPKLNVMFRIFIDDPTRLFQQMIPSNHKLLYELDGLTGFTQDNQYARRKNLQRDLITQCYLTRRRICWTLSYNL